MNATHAGIGATDYAQACELLSLQPVEASPVDRAALLPAWYSGPLVATQAAREKLKARPGPWVQLEPVDVLTRLKFIGCDVMAHVTARTIAERFPPPVADYLIGQTTFIGVGLHVRGFLGAPIDFSRRRQLVVLSGHVSDGLEAFDDLVAHESAHAWLCAEPEPGMVAATAFRMQTIHQIPLGDVPSHALGQVVAERATYERYERECRALTRAWGFKDL